ncbi:transposase [Rhizobium sp. Root482]|nr:transposase [Rhizobium sp. Root482]
MKHSRFTDEQIIGILKEQESGLRTADVCRISDARKLKALEDENAKLKKLLAETMLDNAILKDIASKNVWSVPSVQRFATSQMTIPVA